MLVAEYTICTNSKLLQNFSVKQVYSNKKMCFLNYNVQTWKSVHIFPFANKVTFDSWSNFGQKLELWPKYCTKLVILDGRKITFRQHASVSINIADFERTRPSPMTESVIETGPRAVQTTHVEHWTRDTWRQTTTRLSQWWQRTDKKPTCSGTDNDGTP